MNGTSLDGFCRSYLDESGFRHASACTRLRPADPRLLMLHAAGGHQRQSHSGDKSKRLHDLPRWENLTGHFLTLGESLGGNRLLGATPWSSGIPPQDRKDREQCPPKSVGGLVRHDCKDDADHDADQRHDVSYAKSHFQSPSSEQLVGEISKRGQACRS